VVKPAKTARKNKIVEYPLHQVVLQMLKEHRPKTDGNFVFPDEHAEYRQDQTRITNRFKELFESCGIKTNEEAEHGHRRRAIIRVGFHSLRHSFVSLCAKAGAPLPVVQKLVGHGNPLLTSDVYTHIDDDQKRQAVEKLPDLIPTGSATEHASTGQATAESSP
jgi:integrase